MHPIFSAEDYLRDVPRPTEPAAYAHRGFSPGGAGGSSGARGARGAENSLRAFRAAVDLGYRHLETDARASADGIAFAFHDPMLDRVTNSIGQLRRFSADQIEQARIMGSEPIPRLADLLAAFEQAWFNIDVKSADAIGPVLDAVRLTGSWHRVRLAAFSGRRLQVLRQAAGPAVGTALSPPEIVALKSASRRRGGSVPEQLRRLGERGAHAQVPARLGWLDVVDRPFVQLAHRLGLGVDVWTINDRATMIRLLDLDVDGIMTDRADLLRDVLQERGQWSG